MVSASMELILQLPSLRSSVMARTMPGRCGQRSCSRRRSPFSARAVVAARFSSRSDACTGKPRRDVVSCEASFCARAAGGVPVGGVYTAISIAKWSSSITFFVPAIEPPCSKITRAMSIEAPERCDATAESSSCGEAPTGMPGAVVNLRVVRAQARDSKCTGWRDSRAEERERRGSISMSSVARVDEPFATWPSSIDKRLK